MLCVPVGCEVLTLLDQYGCLQLSALAIYSPFGNFSDHASMLLPSLRQLFANGNRLRSVPETLCFLPDLQVIRLLCMLADTDRVGV
jgi:hypothetical protein